MLEREIARGGRARVEVLVVPHVGRHDHGADLPIVALGLIALRPHERIALAAQNDHMGAGTMGMALLVGADGELGDVAVHRALRHVEANMATARAALFGGDERNIRRIGHEIGGEQKALLLALVGEVIGLACKALFEVMRGVEDEGMKNYMKSR